MRPSKQDNADQGKATNEISFLPASVPSDGADRWCHELSWSHSSPLVSLSSLPTSFILRLSLFQPSTRFYGSLSPHRVILHATKRLLAYALHLPLDLDDHRRLTSEDHRLSYLQTTSAIWTGY